MAKARSAKEASARVNDCPYRIIKKAPSSGTAKKGGKPRSK